VRNAEFWRSRKNEFRRLAEYEYRAVPDPADRRRLYAYGDYTGVKSGATGSWKLRDGLSADFRSSFEEAATMAASGLKAPAGAEPLPFWLHSLAHFLEAQEQTREDRGHLGVWDRSGAASYATCPRPRRFIARGWPKNARHMRQPRAFQVREMRHRQKGFPTVLRGAQQAKGR
jgi:hypothetical protein